MKASLRTVGAIGLFVNDMEKMISFYRDVMGYPIEWDGGILASAELDNGIYINFFPRKEMNNGLSGQFTYPSGINGSFEICLDAGTYSEVDRWYQRLIDGGATAITKPETASFGMRSGIIADPEGNLIEICADNDDTIPAK